MTKDTFAISLVDLPKIVRLATAAKSLLLGVDLELARAHPCHDVEVIDRVALLELADALDALRGAPPAPETGP